MGFDHGPDPLPLGLFEPFRSQAEAGSKRPFALNPLVEGVVGLHPFRIGTTLSAVQQTGQLMAGFWSDAPHAPWVVFHDLTPVELAGVLVQLAEAVRLPKYQKHPRGPKKPKPKKQSGAKIKHVATAQILAKRQKCTR